VNADQTHTIRLPKGTAARIRAATGQPLSSLVRIILIELLAKYEAEGARNVPAQARADVREVVQSTNIEGTDGQAAE
jgi:hypothetical protein